MKIFELNFGVMIYDLYDSKGGTLQICQFIYLHSKQLDQRNWPNPIGNARHDEELTQAFRQWPEIYGLTTTTVDVDFEELIKFLETNLFWQESMNSSPNDFFKLLLSKFDAIPPNLKRVIEFTLSVPYSSADAEVPVVEFCIVISFLFLLYMLQSYMYTGRPIEVVLKFDSIFLILLMT